MVRTRIQRMIGEAQVSEVGKLILTSIGLLILLMIAVSAAD